MAKPINIHPFLLFLFYLPLSSFTYQMCEMFANLNILEDDFIYTVDITLMLLASCYTIFILKIHCTILFLCAYHQIIVKWVLFVRTVDFIEWILRRKCFFCLIRRATEREYTTMIFRQKSTIMKHNSNRSDNLRVKSEIKTPTKHTNRHIWK